ncbi:WUSCHEL-related homeobox 7-like [Oryza brachyantha]|uniref:WUSCHEL-related homeobox 7-like n=1 Tax=Oryza brachyantha TaxID=4533 RepID=UPI001ADBAE36|nr:WUSCHEL-related homeobox 7-like [Oryza brachyantha]
MASSNRHWPSMFRSKHAAQPWQAQAPDMGGSPPFLLSGSSSAGSGGYSLKSSPFSSVGEERVPDPKPRWNPRPEQIRILEAIFNSGMVNPPRDEIPRIRMQLQEYGQVGDANVFYWFQNRKSRSKNKLRGGSGRSALGLGNSRASAPAPREAAAPFTPQPIPPQPVQQQQLVSPVAAAPTSSSSSSSDRSSGSSKPVRPMSTQAMSATAAMDLLSPLAVACHQQMFYQGQPVESATAPPPVPASKVHGIVSPDEPIFLQWPQSPCLSAVDLGAAILSGQYMHLPVPVQQPPSSPATTCMFKGLCNELTGPNTTGHRSCAWTAGLGGQHWSGSADQFGLGKNSEASIAAVSREDAHDHATKLGMLQYGYGITTPAVHVDVITSSDASVLPAVPSSPSPDAAVTVASVAATTSVADFAATAISTGAVANNQLQGLADFGGPGAGAGAAVVCVGIGGAAAPFFYPAAHFNVRHYFGDEAELLRYKGDSRTEPVPVDASGVTVEPLLQGAVYLVLNF